MSYIMNIKDKLHQKFVVDKVKGTDWLGRGSDAPLVVEFDTTEVCNMACPGCISEDLVSSQTSFTSGRLLELAEEMYKAGVKAVILIGGGEPLAHPAVGDFMDFLGSHDIHIGITTNGWFIDRYLETIAKYSRWTRVSMDAASAEGFDRLRPMKNEQSGFAHIVENMRRLAEIKQGELGFSFLIRTEADGFGIRSNIQEIYPAAVLARDIGCDYFEVKPSYAYDGGQPHALVIHDEGRMQEAEAEISRLDALETENFRIVKAINLKDSLHCVNRKQEKTYEKCPVAELRTLIAPSGVYICPYWRGKTPFRIGDAHTESFSDIWNGQRRQQVTAYTNPQTVCGFHCLRHLSNLEVLRIARAPEGEIKTIEEYDRFI